VGKVRKKVKGKRKKVKGKVGNGKFLTFWGKKITKGPSLIGTAPF